MRKRYLIVVILLVTAIFFPQKLNAGGGAFKTNPDSGIHYVGDEVGVEVVFLESDNVTPRPDNNVDIRVQEPADGDKCYMTASITNNEGKAYGRCSSTTAGSIIVYPYWVEGSFTGSSAIIYFVTKPPTPSPSPSSTPVAATNLPEPSQTPVPTSQATPQSFLSNKPLPTLSTDNSSPEVVVVEDESILTRIWNFILRLFGLSN